MRTRTIIDPVIGLVLAIAPAVAAGPSHAWTRQFGTAGEDHASASAIDAARNIYVVGNVEGALPGRTAKARVRGKQCKIRRPFEITFLGGG